MSAARSSASGFSHYTAPSPRGNNGNGHGTPKIYKPRNEPVLPPTQYEDQLQKDAQSSLPDVAALSLNDQSKAQRTPFRPAYGTLGKPVQLLANFFPLEMDPKAQIHRYAIRIEGGSRASENSRSVVGAKRRRIIYLFLQSPQLELLQKLNGIATDFKATLLAVQELPLQVLVGNVKYIPEGSTQATDWYKVELQHTGVLTLGDLLDFVSSTQISRALNDKDDFVQALNIILGHRSKVLSINGNDDQHSEVQKDPSIMSPYANRHYPIQTVNGVQAQSFNLGGGIIAWRGYFLSVRTAAARILVNVQVKHAAAYDAVPLPKLLQDFTHANKSKDLFQIARFLHGLRVHCTHLRNRRPVKTISGLAHPFDLDAAGVKLGNPLGANPYNTFFMREQAGRDKRSSVAHYFEKEYGIRLENYPVVNVGSRHQPIYLPMDVCEVVAGQVVRQDLTPDQTANMIKFAVRRPAVNLNDIDNDGPRALSLTQGKSTLDAFHVRLQPKLVSLQGRQLAQPRLTYKNKNMDPQFGSWNLRDLKFVKGAKLSNWVAVQISRKSDAPPGRINEFGQCLEEFTGILKACGMDVSPCSGVVRSIFDVAGQIPPNQNKDQWKRQCDAQWSTGFEYLRNSIKQKIGTKKPEMLLFILSTNDKGLYNQIKLNFDTKWGIHCVCVVASTFINKGGPGTYANIALKINMKLKGTNHLIHNQSSLPLIKDGKTMVLGIDVTHPSPNSAPNAPSIAAVVASVNSDMAYFPGNFHTQWHDNSGKSIEMVKDLADAVRVRLHLWQKHNGKLPENILVFRDGVSEGQHNSVLDKELPQIQAACCGDKGLYGTDFRPKITIIIVSKRHNTRFYPQTPSGADRGDNVKNGTVVDRAVTEARVWDFYLQAHTALQGTVRPAHFFVVHDEIFRNLPPARMAGYKNSADMVQDLCHKMAYTYGRATKAVSIPPVVYYADLLAERARRYFADLFEPRPEEGSSASISVDDILKIKVHESLAESMWYI